ncbi:MAG: c-type cytochrome [Bacteroidota bacterium]
MKAFVVLGMCASLLLVACGPSPSSRSAPPASVETPPAVVAHPGKQLLRMNCYLCHYPGAESPDLLTAPPLGEIKYHYLAAYPEKDAFVQAMLAFLKDSRSENAIMQAAVKRYGPMAQVPASEADLWQMVTYLYEEAVEVPDWFPAYFEETYEKSWSDQ